MKFLDWIEAILSLVFISTLLAAFTFTVLATWALYNLTYDYQPHPQKITRIVYARDVIDIDDDWNNFEAVKV